MSVGHLGGSQYHEGHGRRGQTHRRAQAVGRQLDVEAEVDPEKRLGELHDRGRVAEVEVALLEAAVVVSGVS